MNGAAGDLVAGLTCMSPTSNSAPVQAFKNSSVSFSVLNLLLSSAFTRVFPTLKLATTLKVVTLLKFCTYLSLSTNNLTATDCTLPAESFLLDNFFHKTGESWKPTILSNALLAC